METKEILFWILIWLSAGLIGSGIRSYKIWVNMTGKALPLLPHQRFVCIFTGIFLGFFNLLFALAARGPLGLHPSTKYFFLKG